MTDTAKMIAAKKLAIAVLILSMTAAGLATDKVPIYPKDLPAADPQRSVAGVGILDDALRARAFLRKIPEFERQRLKEGYDQYEAWQSAAAVAALADRKAQQAEGIALYDEIQKRYRKLFTSRHLTEQVRDDIAYNRALLAFRHSRLIPKIKNSLLTDALSFLKAVSAHRARHSADVLFLKARLWEELGRKEAAASLYHRIAHRFVPAADGEKSIPSPIKAKPSLAALLALVYSGDDYFETSDYDGSIEHYRGALERARAVSDVPRDFVALVQYRLMWALHRNVDEKAAVTIAKKLLKATEPLVSRSDQDKLSQDSLDILAEALLEEFKVQAFMTAVKGIGLRRYRIAFAELVSERLLENNSATDALAVLNWLYHEDPLHRGLPRTMTQLALIYGAQEATGKARQVALDLLRIFEPGSLWRRSHGLTALSLGDQQPMTKKLLSETLADLYHNALRNEKDAKAATTSHRTWLTAFSLSRSEKATALKRLAKLELMGGDIKGSKRYAEQLAALENRPRFAASELDVIIALKRLQQAQAQKKPATARAKNALEQTLAGYQDSRDYNPDSQVLGSIATYYADHGELKKAQRLWRAQLEAAQDSYTRTAALRALLERSLTAKDYLGATQLIERYYFGAGSFGAGSFGAGSIGSGSFGAVRPLAPATELDRVYHKALLGVFKEQKAKGQLANAARHLQDKLERFGSKIPRREELLGLMFQSFAVTGQWPEVIAAYEQNFNDSDSTQPSAKITATYGLALERSMRYLDAAHEYVAFAKRFPKQGRKKQSLTKALALAEGEEAHHLAGDVAFALANRQKSPLMAERYLRVAAKNYALAADRKGVDAVLLAQKSRRSPDQKARLYLTLAHNARRANDWPMAERYAKQAIAAVKSLPADEFTYQYRKMLAESYYLLAKKHIDHVRAKDGLPQLKGLKQRLQKDLATVKTLKHYSQQVTKYGDPEDKLKMFSLIAVTSQKLASQLADVRFRLSQQGDDDKIRAVKRVQTKLRTLASHYFGRADLTLAEAGGAMIDPASDRPRQLLSTDRATATALSAPSSSMFSPDSYGEGGYDGTTWVH